MRGQVSTAARVGEHRAAAGVDERRRGETVELLDTLRHFERKR
jgi:hypothetical protein